MRTLYYNDCVFEESCLNYIYNVTNEQILFKGLSALKKDFDSGDQDIICYKMNKKIHLNYILKTEAILG